MSVPIASPISRTKVRLTLLQNSNEETKAIVEGLNACSLIFFTKCLEVRQEVLYFSILTAIRVRVRAGSGYIVKYRLPDL